MCNSANCTHGEKEHQHIKVEYNEKGEATNVGKAEINGEKILKMSLNYTDLIIVRGQTGVGKTTFVKNLVKKEYPLTTVFYINSDKNEAFKDMESNVDPMFYDEINELEPVDKLTELVVLDEYSNFVENRYGVAKKVKELLEMGYQVVLVINDGSTLREIDLTDVSEKYLELTLSDVEEKGKVTSVVEVNGASQYSLYKAE